MFLLELYYKKIKKTDVPYYAKYSILTILKKPLIKFIAHSVIPWCPFNNIRIVLYRLLGFRVGKRVFIGMKCFLDDMEPSLITIEDGAIISFDVCLVIHGRNQRHTPILIKKNAYIGCRTTILSGKNGITIGQSAIIGGGSLINKDVPDFETWVGVPAHKIK